MCVCVCEWPVNGVGPWVLESQKLTWFLCFMDQGTIVEWTVPIGHPVKEGDVVALVETDKVTVDIKADYDGVVTQHFGAM